MIENTNMRRQTGESDLQYIWRLCSLKDSGVVDLTWGALADILNKELLDDEGEYLSESAYRKKYQNAKSFYDDVFSKMNSHEYVDQIEAQRIELKKERYKLFDQRNAYNKIIRQQARQEELNEIIMRSVWGGGLSPLNYVPNNVGMTDNDLLVSLNDIHYGAYVDNYWQKYNSEVCRQMFCKYLDDILQIARAHDSESCVVWANGDLISGNIHHAIAVSNKENVIEQITGVSELIAEFLAELSKHFKQVNFVSVAGNHSRIDIKDKALMQERLDDLAEWYLSARLQHFDNITIGYGERIDCSMYLMNIRGKTYCGVHGDYDTSASSIQSLQQMVGTELYAVLLAHKHHNKIETVQGIKTVMAGSFLGMDDFCVQKRIYGKPEQMVCVCDNDGIRCSYDIDLRIT